LSYFAGNTQQNGADSEDDKKIISLPTQIQLNHQQQELPKFIMFISSSLFMLTAVAGGPVSKMASQKKKAFYVHRFVVSKSVITAQREFRTRFKKGIILVRCVFFKPCTKIMLYSNHRSGQFKTEQTESLLPLLRHLETGPTAP
jgi:hypothetical protein